MKRTKPISMKKLEDWADYCLEKETHLFKLYDPETKTEPPMSPGEAIFNYLRYVRKHRND